MHTLKHCNTAFDGLKGLFHNPFSTIFEILRREKLSTFLLTGWVVMSLFVIVITSVANILFFTPFCVAYPFGTHVYVVPSTPTDPFLLQFHNTRYFGGCFDPMRLQSYPYNKVVPFIQNFDLLVTSCSINWNNPAESRNQETCPIVLQNRNTTSHKMERVHVHADYRHNKFFVDKILPYYEQRHKETGVGIILHSGGGDSGPHPEIWPRYVNSPAIYRWVVEQNRLQELVDYPKVMFLPTGVCVRENVGPRGVELRVAIADTTYAAAEHAAESNNATVRRALGIAHSANDSLSDEVAMPPYFTVPGTHNSPEFHRNIRLLLAQSSQGNTSQTITSVPQAHRLLQETMRHAKKFKHRLQRVFLCFNEGPYEQRKQFMDHARSGNCTVCDYCTEGMSAIDLWRKYGEYQFVLSPFGNGPDCGRSWEIMLMGAVPLIAYFPGGLGYERGGLAAVTVQSPQELTEHNLKKWRKLHPDGQDPHKLSMEYWKDRMFAED